MSFTTLNKKKLLEAVEYFEVEGVDESNTNKEIVAALNQTPGASWANYQKFLDDGNEPEETVEVAEEEADGRFDNMVLLKMDRQNGTYEIRGHRFTKENPFKLLPENEAQDIIDASDGFRIASPAEARKYYG